jgi:arabinose-5-phosphate isomerase
VEVLAIKALKKMQENDISQLLALDGDHYRGVVHIHNLMKEGIL